jgi:Rieske Fe-S protein
MSAPGGEGGGPREAAGGGHAGLSRRQALCGLACAALGAAGCGAPGGETPGEGPEQGPGCGATAEGGGWTTLSLADYPDLREVGGWVMVNRPQQFLQLVVAHRAPDCFVAVWSICTHGACEVEFRGAEAPVASEHFYCPCHGSRFGAGGEVLVGPATVPLRGYTVVREGDVLKVRRTA